MPMQRFGWILLSVLCFAPVVCAQENSCTERAVVVAANDSHRRSASYDVQVADFRAKVNGKAVKVVGVTKASGSARVVLVLDASGSMSPPLKWQTASGIASEVIHRSPETTQFALIVFADQVVKTIKFGKSQPEILDEISHLSVPHGRSGLSDAVFQAAQLLEPAREGDSVVVISDGGDNHSKVSHDLVQNTVLSQGIRMFFVKFFDHDFPSDERVFGGELGLLAETTGGAVQEIYDPKSAMGIAQGFAAEIANYNVLHIALEEPLRKAASLHLELTDSSGQKRKDLVLMYSQKLFPCATPRAAQ